MSLKFDKINKKRFYYSEKNDIIIIEMEQKKNEY